MRVPSNQTSSPIAGAPAYLLYAGFIVAVAVITTQWEAAALGYSPALGRPVAGWLYNPVSFLLWLIYYWRYAPGVLVGGGVAAVGAMAIAAVLLRAYIGLVLRRLRANAGIHGTAHWASEPEIRTSGLLPRPGRRGAGVYCGAWRDPAGRLLALRHDGPEHVLAIAPTRSGKGVSLVIPTLLSWPHSVFVNDQKRELYHLTSGWRATAAGNRIIRFAPGDPEGSDGYNPLAEVRWGTVTEVGDVQNVAMIIVDPEGQGTRDHWSKTAHALITGVAIHLHYAGEQEGRAPSLHEVAAAFARPNLNELWREMLDNRHLRGRNQPWHEPTAERPDAHPAVTAAAADMLNRAPQEASGVLSTAMSFLALYRDPVVARNVSRSDFRIADLMDAETPVSLYVQVGAEDEQRMRPLMRLLVNQVVEVLMRAPFTYDAAGRQQMPHAHRLLMMLDEFPSLKRLPKFEAALAVMAGYGIKAYLIIQDIEQLRAHDAYGHEEAITSNCHVQIAFAPNKIDTAEWLSKNLGAMTVVTESTSHSGRRWGRMDSVTRTFHQTARPLLTPDEVKSLSGPAKDLDGRITGPGELLVSLAGHAPILGVQSLYFLVPEFLRRSQIPPHAPPAREAAKPAADMAQSAGRFAFSQGRA